MLHKQAQVVPNLEAFKAFTSINYVLCSHLLTATGSLAALFHVEIR